jgi:hypothetical protein
MKNDVPILDDLYNEACNKVSDCFKHCPVICELASKCQHVTELGLNSQPIAVSILAGQPRTYIAYGEKGEQVSKFKELLDPVKGNTTLKIRKGDSLSHQIEPTDMLVIDTYHSSPRLRQELLKHAGSVKRYIVFPSTYAYAARGEDGSFPGLADVIMDFVGENPVWEIIHQVNYNNGMTVIEREPRSSPEMERMYSMMTFDIPEVRWIERHKVGLVHPDKGWDGNEIEDMAKKQMDELNRALRYGVIIGVERNFTTLKIDDREILMGYLVYHVGFRNRPAGK